MLLLLSMDIEAETSEKTFYGVELLTVIDFFFVDVSFCFFFVRCTLSEATGKGYMSCKLDK